MADFNVSVTKHGLMPAVIYAGNAGAVGKTILFTFSQDWEDVQTKEVVFYDLRGNAITTWVDNNVEITIPAEITMYGGNSKFTVRGFNLDSGNYVDDSLQVTGTIVTTYTAGHNPRMEGKLLPSTLDLFLAAAQQAMYAYLEAAKESGDFNGDPAGFADPVATTITLDPQEDASVTVTASGPDTSKTFTFTFSIPRGDSGVYVSEDETDTPHGQNLWLINNPTEGDDIPIPDGMVEDGGYVYLTCEGEKIGAGAPITGKNFTILGHYDTLALLQAYVPNPAIGDAYGIGTETPYSVYLWDGDSWVDFGTIGSGTTVDTAMSSVSANAVQNRVIKEYVDDLIGDVSSAITAINAIVGE